MLKDLLQEHFHLIQITLGLLFGFGLWKATQKGNPKSRFQVRESDRKRKTEKDSPLGEAKFDSPLQIEGIRIDGEPHEILGVDQNASLAEIEQAYKKRMKQYHPDQVARPGTSQWNEAQKIASKINEAKRILLEKKKN